MVMAIDVDVLFRNIGSLKDIIIQVVLQYLNASKQIHQSNQERENDKRKSKSRTKIKEVDFVQEM